MLDRALSLDLHDTRISIRQKDAHDSTFKSEVFDGLVRLLRANNWKVGADRDIEKRYPVLGPFHRMAFKGPLHCAIELQGRSIALTVWSTDWPSANRNGHRHCFDIFEKMPFLTRQRVRLLARQIEAWLRERATLGVTRSYVWNPAQTPMARIAAAYAQSWHTDEALGRPVCRDPRNAQSADGLSLEHGATVWVADSRGRLLRGVAHYHINNMWFVVAGGALLAEPSGHIYARLPSDIRARRNLRRRRARLEALLAGAIRAMDFERAALLRNVLFGAQPIYRIWSTKNDLYYATGFAGYSRDTVTAGAYTLEEARAEVLRVPHHLQLVTPSGARLTASELGRVVAHG